MEEFALAARLQASQARLEASREQLRVMLLPNPATGRIEADVFPRSKVMRAVFHPRVWRVALKAAPMLAVLAGRRAVARRRGRGRAAPGIVPRLVGSVVQLMRR